MKHPCIIGESKVRHSAFGIMRLRAVFIEDSDVGSDYETPKKLEMVRLGMVYFSLRSFGIKYLAYLRVLKFTL